MLDAPKKVKFRRLIESTKEDHDILQPYLAEENKHIADHVLGLLKGQAGNPGPLLVDMYEHGLQCATHAERDGADEERVVVGLLHDIGFTLSDPSHGAVAAAHREQRRRARKGRRRRLRREGEAAAAGSRAGSETNTHGDTH